MQIQYQIHALVDTHSIVWNTGLLICFRVNVCRHTVFICVKKYHLIITPNSVTSSDIHVTIE